MLSGWLIAPSGDSQKKASYGPQDSKRLPESNLNLRQDPLPSLHLLLNGESYKAIHLPTQVIALTFVTGEGGLQGATSLKPTASLLTDLTAVGLVRGPFLKNLTPGMVLSNVVTRLAELRPHRHSGPWELPHALG